ncbi:hypothetical protein Clacol_001930 [Clathrus columnatus]|uniref:Uncharacterized protein n=1 Tax=Clathrus columnatus TaxID=1419009 RepID=A0AAV5A0G2_9AGAM|nr:hypothetical protein Clacol_001930 [Clathrus columnatus]
MTLNLLIAGSFYEQSIAISQGLKDFNASAIFGLNPAANGLNCTIDLSPVSDPSNTANLIDSMVYIESIKRMGARSLLSNASFELSGTEQDLFTGIYQDATQLSVLAGNITVPDLPLGSHPNLTQEDYSSLLFRFNPTCLNDLGLQNLPKQRPSRLRRAKTNTRVIHPTVAIESHRWKASEVRCDDWSTTKIDVHESALMTLSVLVAGAFYEQAISISQGLNNPNTTAILGLNAAASLLNNASIDISPADQNIIESIASGASLTLIVTGNLSVPGVPLNNSNLPNVTLEDFTSLLVKYSPTCLVDLGLENLPTFCQAFTLDPTQQQAIVSPVQFTNNVVPTCTIFGTSGPMLWYVTETADPLSVDPTQRQAQEGSNTCSGPELFFLTKS